MSKLHSLYCLQVQDAVQLILDTQPKGGAAAGGQSREEAVDGLCEDLLSKIPSLFDGEWLRGPPWLCSPCEVQAARREVRLLAVA